MFLYACELKNRGNDEDAVFFLRRCSKLGNPNAMYNLGLYYEQGVEKNIEWTKYCMEKAAEKSHLDAILWLGNAYEHGKENIEINFQKAYEYYTIAYKMGMLNVKDKLNIR
jgi:TPR repeat protein